jgi:transcriptional regulator with XRE-family HTH domain
MPSSIKSEDFFRNRLIALRKQTGMTQEGVAEICGMSVIYYQSIERGVRPNVSLRIIEKIATAFGLSVYQLFSPTVPIAKPISKPSPPPHRKKVKRV